MLRKRGQPLSPMRLPRSHAGVPLRSARRSRWPGRSSQPSGRVVRRLEGHASTKSQRDLVKFVEHRPVMRRRPLPGARRTTSDGLATLPTDASRAPGLGQNRPEARCPPPTGSRSERIDGAEGIEGLPTEQDAVACRDAGEWVRVPDDRRRGLQADQVPPPQASQEGSRMILGDAHRGGDGAKVDVPVPRRGGGRRARPDPHRPPADALTPRSSWTAQPSPGERGPRARRDSGRPFRAEHARPDLDGTTLRSRMQVGRHPPADPGHPG